MLLEKRSTKFGAALIIFAIVLRIIGSWISDANAFWPQRESQGRPDGMIRETIGAVQLPTAAVTTAPLATMPKPKPITFRAEDGQYMRLAYAADCYVRPDLQALLLRDLSWDLSGGAPTVLIIHSHSTESYTRQSGQDYEETAIYRTLNAQYNMIAVGDLLAKLLTEAGIGVIHDRQIHDYPDYTGSYQHSRAAVEGYLEEYPTIQLVMDLHRDAAQNADGSQFATEATVDGRQVAQLMLVMGSDASGMQHPFWQDNLAAALKLQVTLEKIAPGITRQTILRAQWFNQDLSTGSLLVEVGSAGNTLEEALGAIPVLAQAIVELMYGACGA